MSATTATRIFRYAGIYGVLVVLPMYFLEARIGADQPPPITHPEFFFGFIGVTLAWQFVYLLIATDPLRFRPMMLVAVFAKFSYVVAIAVLYALGRVVLLALAFAGVDLLLGMLFLMCFVGLSGQIAPSNGKER